MSLRAELLTDVERLIAGLPLRIDDDELAACGPSRAQPAGGSAHRRAPFRVRRGELPAGNTARRGGRADDLLMLVGDELRVA